MCPETQTGRDLFPIVIGGVSGRESAIFRENISYAKLGRCNRKYLYPELNLYGVTDTKEMRGSYGSMYCTSLA